MRTRLLAVSAATSAAVAFALAGPAAGGPGFKVTFLGQSHTARPGTAWAFYIRATENGRPWQGALRLAVQTPAGKTVDDVGRYAFNGSLLQGYLWNPHDRGHYVFRAVFTQGGRTVGQTSYRVELG